MPATSIDDCSVYYEILGDKGPPVVITPSGRSPLDTARRLAQELSPDFRVLIMGSREHWTLGCPVSRRA
jgi:hypothetical protein